MTAQELLSQATVTKSSNGYSTIGLYVSDEATANEYAETISGFKGKVDNNVIQTFQSRITFDEDLGLYHVMTGAVVTPIK